MIDSTNGLFEPDTLLAAQFFATVRRAAPHAQGEYQLLLAVLQDAIECFQKYVRATDPVKRKLFVEAEEWLMRADDTGSSNAGFSFTYICEVLGLDPVFLRQGLQRWRETTGLPSEPRSLAATD